MTAKVISATTVGFEGHIIEIECDINRGLPAFSIVGLGNKAIDEARDRVRSAINNSHLEFPSHKITINLAPANIPKDGSHFDVPIALSILIASGKLSQKSLKNVLCAGELSLDGSLKPIRGVINIAETAREAGYSTLIVPEKNAAQAALVKDIDVIGVHSLVDVYLHLIGEKKLSSYERDLQADTVEANYTTDIADIKGQEQAKRALIIAAAGGHNILFDGPPGSGKTMLARTLPSILPAPTYEEQIAITKLHSLVGEITDTIVTTRPFRSPHHTSSAISLIGGGTKPMPGEISLAHNGVLFLDELPEYPRASLEALRQPLEDRVIHVARAASKVQFPASFMLVATRNPCPCGYYGDPSHECSCGMNQILAYQKRISGPLLDRIDMVLSVARVPEKDLLSYESKQPESPLARQQVTAARTRQYIRNRSRTNAELSSKNIAKSTLLDTAAAEFLNSAAEKLKLSARSYFKVIKVARTIADLEGKDAILTEHIAEALQYRQKSA